MLLCPLLHGGTCVIVIVQVSSYDVAYVVVYMRVDAARADTCTGRISIDYEHWRNESQR